MTSVYPRDSREARGYSGSGVAPAELSACCAPTPRHSYCKYSLFSLSLSLSLSLTRARVRSLSRCLCLPLSPCALEATRLRSVCLFLSPFLFPPHLGAPETPPSGLSGGKMVHVDLPGPAKHHTFFVVALPASNPVAQVPFPAWTDAGRPSGRGNSHLRRKQRTDAVLANAVGIHYR